MDRGPKIALVAQLVGDPARAAMLAALLDGRALTATELAATAGVSPQTTSGHLAKLSDSGLLSRARQGRHRYFRLASPDVARLLETIMVVAEAGPVRALARRRRVAPRPHLLRSSRRPPRRCLGRHAGRTRLPRDGRRRRRRHVGRPRLLRPGRRRAPGRVAPRLLPPVPGLERTPPAYRRRGRCGDPRARARQGLAAAPARQPRARPYALRAPGLRRHVRGTPRRVIRRRRTSIKALVGTIG